MKQVTLIVFLTFGLIDLFGQVSDSVISAKVDSGYDFAEFGKNLPEARRIAQELITIGETQNSYEAAVRGYFIMGEIHYNLPSKDSAVYWYDRVKNLANIESNKVDEGRAIRSKGTIYFEQGEYDKALSSYDSSLAIWIELADTARIIYTLEYRAWLNNQAERTTTSMNDYLECLEYCLAFKDSSSEAQVYNGLAILHKKQENYELADSYSYKAIEIFEAINYDFGISMAKGNLAVSYKSQGLYDEAYQIYEENLIAYDGSKYKFGILSCYSNMAICSNLMGNYDRAIDEARTAVEMSKEMGIPEVEADAFIELAKSYLGKGVAKSALRFALESLEISKGLVSLEKRREAHLTLSDVYANQDDFDLALDHFKSYKLINDSILNIDKSTLVLDLQEKYEASERGKEINKLKAEAEIDEVKRDAIIVVLFVVILAAILIVNREIRRRKKAKALHAAELKLIEIERSRLKDELAFKKRELTALALQIAQKNEMIKEIKNEILMMDSENEVNYNSINSKFDFANQLDKSWDQFTIAFREINATFFNKITEQYPDISKNELRLCALLKMKLSSKDIASILNISDEGIKKARYRLRKKMGMETSDNLEAHIYSFS